MNDDLDTYLNPVPRTRRNYDDLIQKHASRTGLDPELVRAVVGQESGGNSRAVSPKGAQGIGQLMPATARRFGVRDPFDADENLRGSTDYLKFLKDRYQGDTSKMLAAYNAGEGAVDKFGGIPPYRETQNYVKSITARLGQRQQSQPQPTSGLDAYLDPVSPEQSTPRSQPDVSTPPRATAAPAITDVFDNINRSVTRATEKLKRQAAQSASGSSGVGELRRLDDPEAQRMVRNQRQVREDVVKERRSRVGAYGAPTPSGMLHLIANPVDSLTGLFRSEDENVKRETDERLRQQQIASEPEVTEIRKEYGAMPAPVRSVAAPVLGRGGGGLLKTAGGIASLFGLAPNQLSDWANKRGEIVETASSMSPLDPQLQEVERGVPEKITTAAADIGVGIGKILLLKKATGLSFPTLMALEGAATNSDKPIDQQLGKAAEGYALGQALDAHLSRGTNAALFAVPTAAQTGYEVSQGRMSPLDAAIQTGIQTGAGALLSGRRELSTLERGLALETPRQPVGPSAEIAARLRGEPAQQIVEAEAEIQKDGVRQAAQTNPSQAQTGAYVRDEIGEPLVVYHGTESEFGPFDKTTVGKRHEESIGFHFTNDPTVAAVFAGPVTKTSQLEAELLKRQGAPPDTSKRGTVMQAHLKMERPLKLESGPKDPNEYLDAQRSRIMERVEDSRKQGNPYDGIIVTASDGLKSYIVFEPTQIEPVKGERTDVPQTKVQPPVEAQRAEVESVTKAAQNVSSPDAGVREPLPQPRDATLGPSAEGVDTQPQKFYHRDFGEVEVSPNQKRLDSKKRIRVTDEQGVDHVVRKADLSGRGNQRMVPLREPQQVEQQTEPRPLPKLEDNYRKPLREYADTLYREVSPDGALDMLPTSRRMTDIADVYLSNTLDLALGQGRNKGILLEFEPRDLEGQVNRSKPAWETLYQQNQAEFIARYNKQSQYQQALKSVTIKPDVKMSRVERIQMDRALREMEDAGWVKSSGPEGATYRRPENSPSQPKEVTNATQEAALTPESPTSASSLTPEGVRPASVQWEVPAEPLSAKPATESKLPESTSIKNAATEQLRQDLNLLDIPAPERKSFQQSIDNAQAKGLDKQADSLAREVIEGRKEFLTDEEAAGIQQRMRELENRYEEVHAANPRDPELQQIESQLDTLTRATKQAGTSTARALSFRRSGVDKDFSLVNVIQGLKDSKGRDLTPRERAQAETWVREDRALATQLSEAEQRGYERALQEQIDKATRRRQRQQSKADLDAEAAQIREQLSQAFQKVKSQQNIHSSGLASLDPEGEITKLLLKYAHNRVEANIGIKASELIDEAHDLVKDLGATRRQVAEALSGYGRVAEDRRSEVTKRLSELKSELKRELEAEDISAGRRSPRREGPPKPRDAQRQRELQKQIDSFEEQLRTGKFESKQQREPPRYTKETLELQKKRDEIRAEYQKARYRAERGRVGLITDTAIGGANVPKTLLSMGDVSALGRQGGVGFIQHPRISARDARAMAFKEMTFAEREHAIKNHPDFPLAKKLGLEFTGVDKADWHLSHREEGYLGSDVIDQLASIPVAGNVIKPVKLVKDISERSFTSFLDGQRMDIFAEQVRRLRNMDLTPEEFNAAAKNQAEYINIITGRGSLGKKGNQYAPFLNILGFSPRMVMSRLQLLNKTLNPLSYYLAPKGARRLQTEASIKTLVGFGAMIGLAKVASQFVPGVSVDTNPDDANADFLKVRIHNTRYDPLTGLQQPIRFMIRMAQAIKGGETYSGDSKKDIFLDFGRSKASPTAGLAWDWIEDKNRLTGKKFEASDIPKGTLIPLPVKDFAESINEDGALRGSVEAFPSLLGIGVQTYKDPAEKATTQAEKLARRFVIRNMSSKEGDEGRVQEEIDTDIAKSQLRARARKGEDITADIEAMKANITERQAKALLAARNKTRLQEDFNRLGPKEGAIVYSIASPAEREQLKELLQKKSTRIDLLPPNEQPEVRKRFEQLGMVPAEIPRERPERRERPKRPSRTKSGYAFPQQGAP